jgi:hypothetical protein
MDSLYKLLNRELQFTDAGRDAFFDISPNYASPGFWSAYVARARSRKLKLEELQIPKAIIDYALAIGIERALGQDDSYAYKRKGAGKNYSSLVLLENREQTDYATSEINQCIRELFQEPEYSEFTSTICELVGDLLDNVWAHGKSTGFSMAQKWNEDIGFNFEFAIADCGLGFLRELQRVGKDIQSHQSAIEWCIQKGNSTKKKEIDSWAQRLPSDVMGNPIGKDAYVIESDNHHMGLGLAKLIDAVRGFNGMCWIASGDALLFISPDGRFTYSVLPIQWQGVAIACRFDSSRITSKNGQYAEDEFETILSELFGRTF